MAAYDVVFQPLSARRCHRPEPHRAHGPRHRAPGRRPDRLPRGAGPRWRGPVDPGDRRRPAPHVAVGDPGVRGRRAAVLRELAATGCTPRHEGVPAALARRRRRSQPCRVHRLGAERRAQPDGRRASRADDGGDDRRRRRRVRRRRPAGAATAASTASSCTPPTATSSGSSCRRPPTCATTATAARPRRGPASCVEILEAIRAEVGAEFPVGVRLSADDQIEGGLDPVETAEIARLVEPLVDFVDVSMSSYWRFHKLLSTLDDPLGYELEPRARVVTKAVTVPTIVTGRIMTLDHADHLVEHGRRRPRVDGAGDGRRPGAGRQGPRRPGRGRVRPCIGTTMGCVAQLMTTGRLAASSTSPPGGRRRRRSRRRPRPRCASGWSSSVAARPGWRRPARPPCAATRSQLYDLAGARRAGRDGGRRRRTAPTSAPSPGGWVREIVRLGVAVHTGTSVDPTSSRRCAGRGGRRHRLVAPLARASSSPPRRCPVPGADLPHVCDSWDVLGFGGRATIGSTGRRVRRHRHVRGDLGRRHARGGRRRRSRSSAASSRSAR